MKIVFYPVLYSKSEQSFSFSNQYQDNRRDEGLVI